MKRKRATLVVNPRAGQNLAKISEVLAVLAAADWQTTLALKEYGGHTMALASEAAQEKQDLVIAYGGDGTLNQVVNGVMHADKATSTVGLIPGGTANVWASEVGIPADPVKAALSLVNSEAHRVDVGHIAVEGVSLPEPLQGEAEHESKKAHKERAKQEAKVRQHFLLMAGLGLDAAIMGHVSKPLKYRVGALAVGVSTAKELPAQHTFPIEIQVGHSNGEAIHWKGEALQVVIGNTRLYADIVEMTPDAYIDDGILDVCVITAGNPLTTMQQIASLLLRHHPDNVTAERFQGAHFSLKVPASVALQLDGSAVKLKDYLSSVDRRALAQANHNEAALVTYRFDALPRALEIAIPRSYDGVLFEASDSASDQSAQPGESSNAPASAEKAEQTDEADRREHEEQAQEQEAQQLSDSERQTNLAHAQALAEHGRKVAVVGVSPDPAHKQTSIIAGTTTKPSTGEAQPVAVRVNAETQVRARTGEVVSFEALRALRANDTIVVEGKKSKRGVISAQRVLLA